MTEAELRARVDALKAESGDAEVAHWDEDTIYKDVLHAIARGEAIPDAETLASVALEIIDIDFPRWYA